MNELTSEAATFEALAGSPEIGELATAVFEASPDERVSSVIESLRATPVRSLWIALCREGRFEGIVEAVELIAAPPDAELSALPPGRVVVAAAFESAEQAAWRAAQAGAAVVAVEDSEGRFAGIVPAGRLLSLLTHEHEIDLARIGGFLRGTSRARTASEEPVWRRVYHRAPWLIIGLFGAVLAARIVSAFETSLEDTLALAFFIPGIVYMADAVGTQTETVVIRGLSVGVSIRRIARLEVITGAMVGLLLSAAIFPMALAITGDGDVALTVALALMASAACATVVAMTLPAVMARFDIDPAFGSGPLATVIQDILSIVIYFAIASALVD